MAEGDDTHFPRSHIRSTSYTVKNELLQARVYRLDGHDFVVQHVINKNVSALSRAPGRPIRPGAAGNQTRAFRISQKSDRGR